MGDPPRGTLTTTADRLRHRVRPSAPAACWAACHLVDRIVILRVDWPGMEHENLLVEESLVEVLKGWIIFLVVSALNEGNVIDGLDGPPGVTNLALCLL